MRILCFCKRRPQDRDLLIRPYGRFFYFPYHLARRGHQVTLLLLGHQADPAEHHYQHGFEWHSESLRPIVGNGGPLAYIGQARILISNRQPDWIVGFSDIWYGILAQRLAAHYGCKSLIDAYDNYESYIPWAKPLHWAWRHALRRATALTAAGPNLAELMSRGRNDGGAMIVPMAADPIFRPMDRKACRKQLDLPPDTPLVGYCGSLYRNRGVEILFQVIEILCRLLPGVKLVLSGRRQRGVEIPSAIRPSVIELGYLSDEQMPLLLNAMNVLLAMNRPSAFGNYSYPVKLYEAMQCRTPVVATDVVGTRWILRDHPECLVDSNDLDGIASSIRAACEWGTKDYGSLSQWETSASILEKVLQQHA